MMTSDKGQDVLQDLVEDLVTYGRKLGADEVEVTLQEGHEFGVDVRLGEIENLVDAGSRFVTIKLIQDRKTAFTSSSDLGRATLHSLIKNAVERAALGSSDEFAGLPPLPQDAVDPHTLELFDPALAALDSETKIGLARKTEQIALADQRITNSHGAGFENREIRTILANSLGFCRSFTETYCSLGVGLQAGVTDDLVEGYWGCAKRHFAELDKPEEIAAQAVARTVRQLQPRKIKTQVVPILFEPEMTAWLLGFLFSCVSGVAVYNRATFLMDKLGERIACPGIEVRDSGLFPRRLGSSPFDDDGVPCRETTVLDDGILRNYLCNTYAARKLGLASTGNASGSGVGPTNFYLQAGDTSQSEMIRQLDRGMILIRVLGHGLNSITGDISRGAFGLWVENGEITYPVSEITISGNLRTLLQNIIQVGDDLQFRSAVCGPSLLVEGLTLSGL
ncbi:MAG: TldD/PmbA family protein [Candidatus Aminicenantaceae bacterium]